LAIQALIIGFSYDDCNSFNDALRSMYRNTILAVIGGANQKGKDEKKSGRWNSHFHSHSLWNSHLPSTFCEIKE
jgi:hypothetical protein